MIGLENDYKELMEQLEEELYNIHAAARKTTEADQSTTVSPIQATAQSPPLEPIGTITSLDEGSPAERAVRTRMMYRKEKNFKYVCKYKLDYKISNYI
mgnify:CR=1 FL=1